MILFLIFEIFQTYRVERVFRCQISGKRDSRTVAVSLSYLFRSEVLFHKLSLYAQTSLVAQTVKHLSTMRETWVRSLGWEYPLEKEMAIHSSTIAWKIPWTEELGSLQSMGLRRVRHD